MPYQIYRWRYKSKKPKAIMLVYARQQKTADEIIATENIDNIFFFKPTRFFFKKQCYTYEPPYDLEQQQLSVAEKRLEHRKNYFKDHPEDVDWIAKH